jgi:hypothetical protein
MYIYSPTLEAAAPTVSMVWLRACLSGSSLRYHRLRHNVFHTVPQKEPCNGPSSPYAPTRKVGIQKSTHYTAEMWWCTIMLKNETVAAFESEVIFPITSHVNYRHSHTHTHQWLCYTRVHTTHSVLHCRVRVTWRDAFHIPRFCRCGGSLCRICWKWPRL